MKDSIVLITGAASGIGLQTARQFIDEGATVIGADLSEKNLQAAATELGSQFIAKSCDLTQMSQIKELAEFVGDEFGRLDVLVNNAGIAGALKLVEMEESDYSRFYDILVKAPMFLTKYCIPVLQKADNPSVIIVSSAAARYEMDDHYIYSTAKSAIEKFTYHIVRDFPGIRCNTVLPGAIDTPIFRASPDVDEDMIQGIFQDVAEQAPCGRVGTPEDIANCILFLSSDKAAYINGAAIMIDGGWSRAGN